MECVENRSGMLNSTFIVILAFSNKILVLAFETDPTLQRNLLKFGYGIINMRGNYPTLLKEVM